MERFAWIVTKEEITNRMSKCWFREIYIELKIKLNFENQRSTTS
jgi:hypothetical protein